jgi:hypothetical protein
MFANNSRYVNLETVTGTDRSGRKVQAVKLRRLPATPGSPVITKDGNQLDVMSEERYRDATRFWHIGDANTELEVNNLVRTAGRVIRVPEK